MTTIVACTPKENGKTAFESNTTRPDVLPTMLNKDLPFRYPPSLYAEKVQGNVTLRLFIDTEGVVVEDSTKIVESSKNAMLDTAALRGSRDLRFVPAKLRGAPVGVWLLFPVYFRHPEAPAPAGDTVLHKVPVPESAQLDSIRKADSTKKADSVKKADSAKAAAEKSTSKKSSKKKK